jgi:hypothetical protein
VRVAAVVASVVALAAAGPPGQTPAPDTPGDAQPWQVSTATIPVGVYKGKKLREAPEDWIRWALRNWKTDPFKSHVWAYARVYAPDLWAAVTSERAAEAEELAS